MKYRFWDLDGTVIDSSHRQLTLADGSLDLDNWRKNCTRDKIMRDGLLPLAKLMRNHYLHADIVVVCTARVLSEFDYEFLDRNILPFDVMLSRPEGNQLSDHHLKERLLRGFARERGLPFESVANRRSFFYDDNPKVLNHMSNLGFSVVDTKRLNLALSASI